MSSWTPRNESVMQPCGVKSCTFLCAGLTCSQPRTQIIVQFYLEEDVGLDLAPTRHGIVDEKKSQRTVSSEILIIPMSSSCVSHCLLVSVCATCHRLCLSVPFFSCVGRPAGANHGRVPNAAYSLPLILAATFQEALMTLKIQSSISIFFLLPCRAEQCVFFVFSDGFAGRTVV